MKNNKLKGILLVVLGVLLLFSSALEKNFQDLFTFGNLLTVFLTYLFFEELLDRNYSLSAVYLIVIYFFQYDNLHKYNSLIPDPVIFAIAAFVLGCGISILFPRKKNNNKFVVHRTNFASSSTYVDDSELKYYTVKSSFAESSYYFDHAKTLDNEVELHLNVTCGSVNIYLPYHWKIVGHPQVLLAEFKIFGRPIDPTVTVNITGNCKLCEVKVIYQ